MKRLFAILSLSFPLLLNAQEKGDDGVSEGLGIKIEALSFFRDNEYDHEVTDGYTLPGTWIRPVFSYDPNSQIHLEAGAHALFFDGANKYPCYAYHDIGKWKGKQYQSGAHILPWFRAEADMGKLKAVMGDIYGDKAHGYSTPLYNNEQILSADPEMGAQLLYTTKHFNAEAYVNWQSYQFKEDTHQEAFTVGVGADWRPTRNKRFTLPVRILAQHRGGEQDIPSLSLGVQTICNASVGANYTFSTSLLNDFTIAANILGCYQQSGHLWPFESGLAYNAEVNACVGNGLEIKVGEFYAPGNFVSLYGNPFFSTLSTKTGIAYDWRNTAYASIDYSYTIGRDYTFGANLELFQVNSNDLREFNFAFGLYIRVSPSFRF